MDDIARLPIADRSDLFLESARQRGLTPAIIEKIFGFAGHSSGSSRYPKRLDTGA
jgi:hypothetical protein